MSDKIQKIPGGTLSYRNSGVDVDAGDRLVEQIRPLAEKTWRPGCLGAIGGFSGLFELPLDRYRHPVLVSGTDGVGTKLKLAFELDRHDTIGIDLVAMCVNDLIVAGAEPLFFLDYYATGKLNVDVAAAVVDGIGTGCELSGCSLVGGETAEMPGMYEGEDYDLAGFCVGIAEKSKLIDGSHVKAGDVLIGLASSGPHSNGYSLIRKIIEVSKAELTQPLGDTDLASALMAPTRIYVKQILTLLKAVPVNALSHITGGGLLENIPRVLPQNTKAIIDTTSWALPEVFKWLQQAGNVTSTEMYRTFNCGVGMIIAVPENEAENAMSLLAKEGETVWKIGVIAEAQADEEQIELNGLGS